MKLTLSLIIINIIAFFFTFFFADPEYIITNYGFSINSLLEGNYYTLISSMFLHAGPSHLAGNMIALFFLGWTLERNIAKWKYLLAYFSAGILGNLVGFVPIIGFSPETLAVGASAAISGLVGLGVFVCPGKPVLFPTWIPLPFIVAGAIYLIANITNLFNPSNIAYSAHIFGFVGGAIWGAVWGEHRIKRLSVLILLLVLMSSIPFLVGYVFLK